MSLCHSLACYELRSGQIAPVPYTRLRGKWLLWGSSKSHNPPSEGQMEFAVCHWLKQGSTGIGLEPVRLQPRSRSFPAALWRDHSISRSTELHPGREAGCHVTADSPRLSGTLAKTKTDKLHLLPLIFKYIFKARASEEVFWIVLWMSRTHLKYLSLIIFENLPHSELSQLDSLALFGV